MLSSLWRRYYPHGKIAARCDFFVKSLLHFCKFLTNANFDLVTSYILREINKLHFRWLEGTGDLAQDMENQMKANNLRIEVLERENAKLKKSVCKLMGANDTGGRHGSAPVQLWNYNAANST